MASPTQNSVWVTSVNPASAGVGKYLIYGTKWGGGMGQGVTLTYSFPTDDPDGYAHFITNYSYDDEWDTWHSLSVGERTAVVNALNVWSSFANIKFVRTSDDAGTVGELRFAYWDDPDPNVAAHAYLPSSHPSAGDVWFDWQNFNFSASASIANGTDDFHTILHEIGHALGLKHPFEGPNIIPSGKDNYFYTIMSYTASPWSSSGDGSASFYPTTPMYYDLVAIQALYGRNTSVNAGNTTYVFKDDTKYWQAINDGSGVDTIVYNGLENTRINLNPGTFSSLSEAIRFSDGKTSRDTVTIGPGVVIENATGGRGHDRLIGNGAANILNGGIGNDALFGGAGNDRLVGGAGADKMYGGAGNDIYHLDNVNDIVNESTTGSAGIDTVHSVFSFSLANTARVLGQVEKLALLGTTAVFGVGNGLNNVIVGNGIGNLLDGAGGNDLLSGGGGNDTLLGGAGADRMRGGAGNDIYRVDSTADIVDESIAGSSGRDTVQSTISFSLGNGARVLGSVENLVLLGTLAISGTGNGLSNAVVGNAAANVLNGGAANDVLNGRLGNDTLIGGAGKDTFIFNTALGASNVDGISDFVAADDTIRLENAIFTALTAVGELAASAFARNSTGLAQDAYDRIIYETDTGSLNYDHNGSTAGGGIHFARLTPNLALTSADFHVV